LRRSRQQSTAFRFRSCFSGVEMCSPSVNYHSASPFRAAKREPLLLPAEFERSTGEGAGEKGGGDRSPVRGRPRIIGQVQKARGETALWGILGRGAAPSFPSKKTSPAAWYRNSATASLHRSRWNSDPGACRHSCPICHEGLDAQVGRSRQTVSSPTAARRPR
jgi:hypothetical protein